ncbi:acyl-CoA thioesterase [Anaeromyxobacter paludicola]|uniref:Acyl-CoA thioesterase n=1 Tax=Anaeromyxobacter paludicola TaxID=2918171 RepID=A0ABN6N1Y5_9BACT|nr:acyl-CoA thioesterase [Anaeromyxobacter paludicola]BDG06946.1 acyl-CoA thioesterase [Anaeromyxobacter paludicola]
MTPPDPGPGPAAKLASSSCVEMTELVMPSDANRLGTAFGGKVVSWVDLAAGVAAQRHTRTPCVTASIDQLSFLSPIHVGDVVILRARVNAVFGSSMEIEVEVEAEETTTGERRPCLDAFLTFVSLGADGKPQRAPMLLAVTEDELRRQADAQERRAARLASRRARAVPGAAPR